LRIILARKDRGTTESGGMCRILSLLEQRKVSFCLFVCWGDSFLSREEREREREIYSERERKRERERIAGRHKQAISAEFFPSWRKEK
jgi:hypothetical protein